MGQILHFGPSKPRWHTESDTSYNMLYLKKALTPYLVSGMYAAPGPYALSKLLNINTPSPDLLNRVDAPKNG